MTEFSALRQKTSFRVHEAAIKLGHTEKRDSVAFTFIDLFAGIGGLRRGFEAINGECIFTCEWDRYSQQTYRENFPSDSHEIAGDICEVREADIPAHDVLLAGFPCQPFSIAGVSKKNALNRPHGFALASLNIRQ